MENASSTVAAKKTKTCPHCQVEVDLKASRCPHCHGKIYMWGLGRKFMAGFIVFSGIMFLIGYQENLSTEQATVSAPAPSAEEIKMQEAQLAAWQKTPAGKLCGQHPSWKKEDCDLLVERKIWIGMSLDMLKYSRGNPDDINVSNYGNGNQYQYCWNDRTPSCFYDKDGDEVMDSYN